MKVNFFKSVHKQPSPEYKPSIVSKLKNKVLVGGIIGSLIFGFASDSLLKTGGSVKEEEKVEVVFHGVPIITVLGWSANEILEEELFKFVENGRKTKAGIPVKLMVTEKEKKCLQEHLIGQADMIKLFLNHVFENLPRTLQRLGLTAFTQEEIREKLSELEIMAFSPEKWSETCGKDSRAIGYYWEKVVKIKLLDKDVDERVAAPSLYDTLVHEILHHLSGGYEGQSHKSKAFHEMLTAIITAQTRLKTANIPTSMTLQPNEAGALKEGLKDKCNVAWLGDESLPSYPQLSINDEIQEWITRIGFKLILNAYFTGDFTEVEKKTNAIFGKGALKNFFPTSYADVDLFDSSVLEKISNRISRDILESAKKLSCPVEDEPAERTEVDECE